MSTPAEIASTFEFLPLVAQIITDIQNDSEGLQAVNSIKLLIEKIRECKSFLKNIKGVDRINVDSINQFNALTRILESKLAIANKYGLDVDDEVKMQVDGEVEDSKMSE